MIYFKGSKFNLALSHFGLMIEGSCPIIEKYYYLLSCFGLFASQIVDSGYLRFENLEKLDLSALLAVLFEFTQITASYYFIHIIFIG